MSDHPAEGESVLSRRQGIALVLAAAVTLGGAGYSVATLDSRQALAARASSITPSPASVATSPAPAAPAPTSSARSPSVSGASPAAGSPAVANRLLQPPAPWQRLSDAAAKTGRVNLSRAVAIDGHGTLSRVGLRQLGFRSGWSRAWQAGGCALLVLDYTFRDGKGAAGFVTYGRLARDADARFRRMSVTGIPGAVAYRTAGIAGPSTQVALFARGRSAYIVGVQGTPPPGAAGNLSALARQQYDAAVG